MSAMPPIISNVPNNGRSANVSRLARTIPKAHIDENKSTISSPPALDIGLLPQARCELKVGEFLATCSQTSMLPVKFRRPLAFAGEFSTTLGFLVVGSNALRQLPENKSRP